MQPEAGIKALNTSWQWQWQSSLAAEVWTVLKPWANPDYSLTEVSDKNSKTVTTSNS